MKPSDRVNRIQDQEPKGATIRLVQGFAALIDYDEGGEGWWSLEALELDDLADWARFRNDVLNSPQFLLLLGDATQHPDAEVRARAAMLVPLYLLAEAGTIGPFQEAWHGLVAGLSIPSQLIASAVAAAQACQLPAEFVAALSP